MLKFNGFDSPNIIIILTFTQNSPYWNLFNRLFFIALTYVLYVGNVLLKFGIGRVFGP